MVMVLVKTKNLWYHPCGFEKNVYSWIHVWDRNIINGFQKIEGLNNIATIPYGDFPDVSTYLLLGVMFKDPYYIFKK